MTVTLGILREYVEGESRVSIVPEIIPKLNALGISVIVESGAGKGSYFTDDMYRSAGATVSEDRDDIFWSSDIIAFVQYPSSDDVPKMKRGSILIGLLSPEKNMGLIDLMDRQGVTAFSMERIPRTTRAQSMDVLTSQSSVAGYVGAVIAAANSPRLMPMLSTAAGTVKPSRVLVLGAGVAGLMTIATLRRLGAVVTAYDVRKPAKEDVKSLGAKFLDIDIEASSAGGYARELTDEEKRRQQEILVEAMVESDVIITTASVPGKKAPILITKDSVERMSPGTVIVDLSADSGGNCELTVRGETVLHNGVKIIGVENPAARMPVDSSRMYSRNMVAFIQLILKDGRIDRGSSDELLVACRVNDSGRVG